MPEKELPITAATHSIQVCVFVYDKCKRLDPV